MEYGQSSTTSHLAWEPIIKQSSRYTFRHSRFENGHKRKKQVFLFLCFLGFCCCCCLFIFFFSFKQRRKGKVKEQTNEVIGKAERSDPQQTCNSSSCPEVGFMKVNSFVCGSLPYLGFSANRGVFHFAKGIIPICLFVFNFI